MILPTMNGESVDPAGQPALKTEERKVTVSLRGGAGGCLEREPRHCLPPSPHLSSSSPTLISELELVPFRESTGHNCLSPHL